MADSLQSKTAKTYFGPRQCTWCTLTATKCLQVEGKTVAHGCNDHARQWLVSDI